MLWYTSAINTHRVASQTFSARVAAEMVDCLREREGWQGPNAGGGFARECWRCGRARRGRARRPSARPGLTGYRSSLRASLVRMAMIVRVQSGLVHQLGLEPPDGQRGHLPSMRHGIGQPGGVMSEECFRHLRAVG